MKESICQKCSRRKECPIAELGLKITKCVWFIPKKEEE